MRRAALQGMRLAGTIVQALLEHGRISAHSAMTLPERAEWLHRWCVVCLRRLGAEYSFYGRPPEGSLLLANHLSYLDVIVLSAIAPCVFVAKQEVEDWPIFGRMARHSGTVFVNRERRSDVQRVTEKIAQAARSGTMVVLFPEGGSSSGRTVLPFYSSLLQPAVELELPITPAHLSYTLDDGDPETDIGYWGDMTLAPHLWKLLGKRGVRCTVRFGMAQRFSSRKEAAVRMHSEVLALAAGDAESAGRTSLRLPDVSATCPEES